MKRKFNLRAIVLLISLAVLLMATVGATLAYIIDQTDEVTNEFTPSHVACQVIKNEDGTFCVENTGDTDAYIRVAVVVTWKKDNAVYAQAPEFYVTEDGWEQGSDGYYYYTKVVSPSERTSALTISCTASPPDDYALSVEVVASAIQATVEAVKDWSSAVSASPDGESLTTES